LQQLVLAVPQERGAVGPADALAALEPLEHVEVGALAGEAVAGTDPRTRVGVAPLRHVRDGDAVGAEYHRRPPVCHRLFLKETHRRA
jgi:hypothetical protein